MGVELGDETYIHVRVVSSALSPPISTLIGIDDFYTNLVWKKLVFLSFRGYLGEIESENKKHQNFSYTFFFLHVQCCVWVSASNFQVLTRKIGDARASGNIVCFLAGPARTTPEFLTSPEI